MALLSKFLILIHRYLGTVLSALFVMWFLTGIGMIYSRGMPRLSPDVRLARLPALDLAQVRLTLSEAAERAGATEGLERAVLLTVMDRPAYRFTDPFPVTVFADDGELLGEVGPARAMRIGSRFMNLPEDQLRYAGLLEEADQWTLTQRRHLPLHKIMVEDAARTELYVSAGLGEVVVITTRGSRALAWISTIPHWLYFAPLRVNNELWRKVVLWTSGLGCVLALLGIVLAFLRFKPSRPFRLSRVSSYIPYSGWMKWHYVTGVLFGVLTLTWVFSGMLSMEPWYWTAVDRGLDEGVRQALTGGTLDPARFPAVDPPAWKHALAERPIKEVEFTRIMEDSYYVVRSAPERPAEPARPDGGHQPYYVVRGGTGPERFVIAANPFELRHKAFSTEVILGRLKEAIPEASISESELLTEYDSYYYSRDQQARLPVLRVKFDDPEKTWLYIDPEINQLVARIHRMNRVERWLYNGLHSLDFPFWYGNRPLWEIGVIVLSIGGAAVSGLGLFLGFRRMLRFCQRIAGLQRSEIQNGG